MKVVVTGGGTGGHVYPALEVARELAALGVDLHYLGSLRGAEGKASEAAGLAFRGYPTFPLVSIRSVAGLRARVAMLRAIPAAKADLRAMRPAAVFSTGGYSSGPVMAAARSLGIPLCLHACDSVPGRALRMHARIARSFTCSFRSTGAHLERLGIFVKPNRTGQPIRAELRAAIGARDPDPASVVVLGGSQGSIQLLRLSAAALERGYPGAMLVSTGPKNFDAHGLPSRADVRVMPYLGPAEMAQAYRTAGIALARSGGTIAEFAMARLPSVLVPLADSADDHQRENAREFAAIGAADLFEPKGMVPQEDERERLVALLEDWQNLGRRIKAEAALADWDIPDAAARIAGAVLGRPK